MNGLLQRCDIFRDYHIDDLPCSVNEFGGPIGVKLQGMDVGIIMGISDQSGRLEVA
jgi:hypothetical protein